MGLTFFDKDEAIEYRRRWAEQGIASTMTKEGNKFIVNQEFNKPTEIKFTTDSSSYHNAFTKEIEIGKDKDPSIVAHEIGHSKLRHVASADEHGTYEQIKKETDAWDYAVNKARSNKQKLDKELIKDRLTRYYGVVLYNPEEDHDKAKNYINEFSNRQFGENFID